MADKSGESKSRASALENCLMELNLSLFPLGVRLLENWQKDLSLEKDFLATIFFCKVSKKELPPGIR